MEEYIKDRISKIWNSSLYFVACSLYLFIGTLFFGLALDGVWKGICLGVSLFCFMVFSISFAGFLYREWIKFYDKLGMHFAIKNQRSLYKKYKTTQEDSEVQKGQKEYWQDRYMREEYEKKYWQKLYFAKRSKEGFDTLSKKELKIIYKKAANLSHPDKAKDKDEAHKIFSELQNAYEDKDTNKVINIYINLLVDRYKLN
ncbi:MAG: J domain-containing protein [Campylobacter sp.]|nr:J domain-containing protein [Campylobacter sp.]